VVTSLYPTSFTLTRNIAANPHASGSGKGDTCEDMARSGESCTLTIQEIIKSNIEGQNDLPDNSVKMLIRCGKTLAIPYVGLYT
jgi:hypothetical protein